MTATGFTVLSEGREHSVVATIDGGRVLLDPDVLAATTGWTLKPEGLCRGDVCVPLRGNPEVLAGDLVDLEAFAVLLRIPVAVDAGEGVVALGEPVPPSTGALGPVAAPDFTLDTFDGAPFTFSAVGRKKKVLTTWASW